MNYQNKKIEKEGFDDKDLNTFEAQNTSVEDICKQLKTLRRDPSYINLKAPATIGNGICILYNEEQDRYLNAFEEKAPQATFCQFIPASGKGSRMLKDLEHFYTHFNPLEQTFGEYLKKSKNLELLLFFKELEVFPFYARLQKELAKLDVDSYSAGEKKLLIAKLLLYEKPFEFLKIPKALLPFHKYKNGQVRTAFAEQVCQFLQLSNTFKKATIHFTIDKDYYSLFEKAYIDCINRFDELGKPEIEMRFSYQNPSSNTIALNHKNKIARDTNNHILFRPAGHGALLRNLNAVEADFIYISNIDNVAKKGLHKHIAHMRKVLCGVLMDIQGKIFEFLHKLDTNDFNEKDEQELKNFLYSKPFFSGNEVQYKQIKKKEDYHQFLNRPLRICGVVANNGQPGGGPFWVKEDKKVSLQIVEKSEIDTSNKKQASIFSKSTHFNPVEICCSTRNYKGEKFDLEEFKQEHDGMIGFKMHAGNPITILEKSGLWNGAMFHWNTIFVAIEEDCFNPVKSINDLLYPSHQP